MFTRAASRPRMAIVVAAAPVGVCRQTVPSLRGPPSSRRAWLPCAGGMDRLQPERSGHLMESRALLSHVLEVRLRTLGDADDETLRVGSQATRVYRRTAWRRVPALVPDRPGVGQGVCLLERSQDRFVDMLRQRPYSVLIFSSLSRLAVMDSRTELVPLIHAPPSLRRSSGKGP